MLDDLSLDEPVDLLYLVYKNGDRGGTMRTSNYTITSGLLWSAGGYCLSVNGARKLLSKLPVNFGLDVWMSHQFPLMRVRAATPVLLQHTNYGGGNIRHSDMIVERTQQHSDKKYVTKMLLNTLQSTNCSDCEAEEAETETVPVINSSRR